MSKKEVRVYLTDEPDNFGIDLQALAGEGVEFKRPHSHSRARVALNLSPYDLNTYCPVKKCFELNKKTLKRNIYVTPLNFRHPHAPTHVLSDTVLVPPSFTNFSDWDARVGGLFAMRDLSSDISITHTQSSKRTVQTGLAHLAKKAVMSLRFNNGSDEYNNEVGQTLSYLLFMVGERFIDFKPIKDGKVVPNVNLSEMFKKDLTDSSDLVARIRIMKTNHGHLSFIHLTVSGNRVKSYFEATGFIPEGQDGEWNLRSPYCG